MAPRAMWTGQLRISLVNFGVRLYAATESSRRVSMNQLHKDCHQRVRNQLVCPTHGPVNREDITKGYEHTKGSYVIIEPSDIESIRLESNKTIELTQFVDATEIDPLYVNAPYYLGPDGPVAEDAFRVVREAMARAGKVGIGKVVMHGREQVVALSVSGKGFLLTTLRYAGEVRESDQFFSDIKDVEVDEEQVQLAESIMKSKAGTFEPSEFEDKYREAFFEIVKAKVEGQEPVGLEEAAEATAFNFMDALKQSVAEVEASKKGSKKTTPKKPAAKSVTAKKAKSRKRA